MLTKQLNHTDLRRELERDGLLTERPDLAFLVLRGESPYVTRDAAGVETEFALQGAPVARSVPAAPTAAPAHIPDAEAEQRLDAIFARRSVAAVPVAAPAGAHTSSDPSADLVRAAGAEPYTHSSPSVEASTESDAGADLVRLALADTDPDDSTDHLFPEPPSAA